MIENRRAGNKLPEWARRRSDAAYALIGGEVAPQRIHYADRLGRGVALCGVIPLNAWDVVVDEDVEESKPVNCPDCLRVGIPQQNATEPHSRNFPVKRENPGA